MCGPFTQMSTRAITPTASSLQKTTDPTSSWEFDNKCTQQNHSLFLCHSTNHFTYQTNSNSCTAKAQRVIRNGFVELFAMVHGQKVNSACLCIRIDRILGSRCLTPVRDITLRAHRRNTRGQCDILQVVCLWGDLFSHLVVWDFVYSNESNLLSTPTHLNDCYIVSS